MLPDFSRRSGSFTRVLFTVTALALFACSSEQPDEIVQHGGMNGSNADAPKMNSAGTEHVLVCTNPRRSYAVYVDRVARTFVLNPDTTDTHYQVREIVDASDGFVVRGRTVGDGPNFVAHVSSNPRIDLFFDGELFQTDECEWSPDP